MFTNQKIVLEGDLWLILRDQILKSQIAYYNGLIAKHQQNVEIYLNQPVGIGEHSDVMGTIDRWDKCYRTSSWEDRNHKSLLS